MTAIIEILNQWGESFLNFAWPMLWQSSLLITIVFVFDVLAARRLRAAVRYALWLAVLVKLVLPPALALPTGATWWLWHAKPPLVPVMKSEVVTFDAPTVELPSSAPQTVPFVLPPPELSGAGWVFIAVNSVEAALVFWLVFRWWRVASKVRRAMSLGLSADEMRAARDFANGGCSFETEYPGRRSRTRLPWAIICHPYRVLIQRLRRIILNRAVQGAGGTGGISKALEPDLRIVEALQGACELAGLRRCPRLKLVDDVQSPAVYGLFRPVILLPRSLVEKLSVRQLRAVLLHEAIHLRRGDVWINCAQTLLQIAYWWHPLLWLANARIRRLREEAVDDAVMLALRADADAYAPTLLEVAKYSFRRPLTLALVGILESRSALRRRIERLVDFRPPHKAGLTLLSLCSICVFSAIALPMGQGPAVDEKPGSASTVSETTTNAPQYEMREFKVDTSKFFSNLRAALPPPAIAFLFQTNSGLIYDQTDPKPFIKVRSYSLADISAMAKKYFESRGLKLDPPKQVYFNDSLGVLFVYATPADLEVIERDIRDHENANIIVEQGKLDYETGHFNEAETELHQALVVDPHNPAVQYYSALVSQAITNRLQASKVSIPQDSRVFSEGLGKLYVSTNTKVIGGFPIDPPPTFVNSDHIVQKAFYVWPIAFYAAVREKTGEATFDSFKQLVVKAGVDLSPPKQLFFNEDMDTIYARATTNDLKIIADFIDGLNCLPPMVHIKARFIEVSKKFFTDTKNYIPAGVTNGIGILSNPNFQVLLHELEQQKDVEEFAEPEVTTITGRQTEMRATIIQPVVTNYTFDAESNEVVPQVAQIETGPILDVVPLNTTNAYTVSLWVEPSLVKFLGYSAPPKDLPTRYAINSLGDKISLPFVSPIFKVDETTAQKTLYDGQTLVLFPTSGKAEEERADKVLIVFVTDTLIGPTGNRLHSDKEMTFAQNAVPPQSPSSHPLNFKHFGQALPAPSWPPTQPQVFPHGSTDYYDFDPKPYYDLDPIP